MNGLLRPDVIAAAARWREVLGAGALVGAGLWLASLGGWFFQGLGLLVTAVGAWGAVFAWRRLRLRREVDQPGIVEVDEGQVRYFGPHGGGFAALPELVEVEIIVDLSGRRWWRLREAGGNVLSVPVAATGAEALLDAFAVLPGLDLGRLSAALATAPATASASLPAATLWRRGAAAALPPPPANGAADRGHHEP